MVLPLHWWPVVLVVVMGRHTKGVRQEQVRQGGVDITRRSRLIVGYHGCYIRHQR